MSFLNTIIKERASNLRAEYQEVTGLTNGQIDNQISRMKGQMKAQNSSNPQAPQKSYQISVPQGNGRYQLLQQGEIESILTKINTPAGHSQLRYAPPSNPSYQPQAHNYAPPSNPYYQPQAQNYAPPSNPVYAFPAQNYAPPSNPVNALPVRVQAYALPNNHQRQNATPVQAYVVPQANSAPQSSKPQSQSVAADILAAPTSSTQNIKGTEFTTKTITGNFGEVRNVLREWEQTSASKYNQIHIDNFNANKHLYQKRDKDDSDEELYYDDGVYAPPANRPDLCKFSIDANGEISPIIGENDTDNAKQFSVQKHISQMIYSRLDRMNVSQMDTPPTVKVSIANGEVQSIAVIDETKNELVYLVTNPNNINHAVNTGKRVNGAGTAILRDLADNNITAQKPLKLDAVKEAKRFYEIMGCKTDSNPANVQAAQEKELHAMELTADKVASMRQQRIGLFKGT